MNPYHEAVRAAVKLAEDATPEWKLGPPQVLSPGTTMYWLKFGSLSVGANNVADAKLVAAAHDHVTLIQQLSDALDAEIAARATRSVDDVLRDAEIDKLDKIIDEQAEAIKAKDAEIEKLKLTAKRFEWLRDHYHGFEHYRIATGHVSSLETDIDKQLKALTTGAAK